MRAFRRSVEAIALAAFGIHGLRRHALRLAARRGRDLIVLYHRVEPSSPDRISLVPSATPELFEEQLQTLRTFGDIVPLAQIVESAPSGDAIRFAITFDDDSCRHVQHALPILRRLDVPATFFLSGRALHAAGPYWWERLEAAILEHGLEEVARMLGCSVRSPGELVTWCENAEAPDELLAGIPSSRPAPLMEAAEICELAEAGMEIGFHTVRHPFLPRLDRDALDAAFDDGKQRLADLVGAPLHFFAYPHGAANAYVARRAEELGYRAAFTNLSYPVSTGSDRFLLGRWDVRSPDLSHFGASAALRLSRPHTGPQRSA